LLDPVPGAVIAMTTPGATRAAAPFNYPPFDPTPTMTSFSKLLKPLATVAALSGLTAAATAQSLPWNELFPATSPSVRERVGAASDGTVAYIYGGQVSTTTNGYDELWSFDGTNYAMLTASGAGAGPRTSPGLAWDTSRGKLVVFSGKGAAGVWADYETSTWEWDPVGGWAQMTPATVPDARWLYNMEYVPGIGSVFHGGVAWNGTSAYRSNETWAWDGLNWNLLSTTGPARGNGHLVYRPTTNDMVYFGGVDAANVKTADTFIYDIATNTWAQIITATLPTSDVATGGPALVGAAGYFDPATGKTIIQGGQGNGGGPSKLTWEFDGLDWTDVTPATSPNVRNCDAVWNAATNRAYTFLGSTGSANDETWERGVAAVGSFTVKGTDCATGAGLTASISSPTMPAINTNLVVEFGNLTPGTLTLAVLGGSDATIFGGLPLPIPFGTIFPGSGATCNLQVSNDIGLYTPVPDVSGTSATLTLPVPNDPTFVGLTAFVQGVQIELGAVITAANTAYGEILIGQL